MRVKVLISFTCQLTPKGSTCFQLITDPHVVFLDPSGRDSGTTRTMKRRLMAVMMVASSTTYVSPSSKNWMIQVPRAGLTTKLAANVAETYLHVITWCVLCMYVIMCVVCMYVCVCVCVCMCVCVCVCVCIIR